MLAMLLAFAAAAPQPLAVRVEVESLGRGRDGTVVGVALQIAPEDRDRAGERVDVELLLVRGGKVVDTSHSVVRLSPDGSALLYREWAPGEAEVRMKVASLSSGASGAWAGTVVIRPESEPFQLPEEAPPDAVVLAPEERPAEDAVHFRPPPRSGGVGALQLEVTAPAETSRVVFYANDEVLFEKTRAPWTVSVTLGTVARRTVVRAEAYGADHRFLGEDAVVLNAPSGRLPVEILLGPSGAGGGGRQVTVAVGGDPSEVVLKADDTLVARWTSCPCVTRIPEDVMAGAKVLAADARGPEGLRGDSVLVLGSGGFVDQVQVEQVELPVVVMDAAGRPVSTLPREAFTVFEDGREVTVDAFGTTADLPLALGLVVDTSGSMEKTFKDVREAVDGFVRELLRPGDQVFLLPFSWDAKVEVQWSSDPRGVKEALEGLAPEGGTSLNDAVVRALEEFRGRRGRTALVLLTDGEDTTSRTQWDTTLRFARTMRTPVFPIGFRIPKLEFLTRGRLKDLAAETGGEAFFARGVEDLKDVYARIGEQLRAQYLLSYRSPSTAGPDTFRTVRVEVNREGLTPRTISGYYPGR